MSIHHIGSDLVRPFGRRGIESPEAAGEGSEHDARAPAERADRVELSSEGRALAARLAESQNDEGLTAGRAAEIRARIDAGVYDDASVAREVARRILASGDLLPSV